MSYGATAARAGAGGSRYSGPPRRSSLAPRWSWIEISSRRGWPSGFRPGAGAWTAARPAPRGAEMQRPSQKVLPRTAMVVDRDVVEARMAVGLPARGRSVDGRAARAVLPEELPEAVGRALPPGGGAAARGRAPGGGRPGGPRRVARGASRGRGPGADAGRGRRGTGQAARRDRRGC